MKLLLNMKEIVEEELIFLLRGKGDDGHYVLPIKKYDWR
jgi:hypothetical protein